MQIETKQKTQPVTYIEALASLWCVKLRLGQYPVYISWTGAEQPPYLKDRKGEFKCEHVPSQ